MNKSIFLFFGLFLTISVFSQKPESLSYHLKARSQTGEIFANQRIQFVLFLSENSPDGRAIYQESHLIQTDEEGMVQIDIGSGRSSQNFSDLIIDPRNDYYLSINAVEPVTDETLFKRNVQLLILPMGIYAGSIENMADSYFFSSSGKELKALYMKDEKLFLSNGGYVKIPDFMCNCNSLLVSANKVNVSCYGQQDGYIDLTVMGGAPPYSFHWSNGAKTEDIYDLKSGEYTVYVSDINGFTAVKRIVIEEPEPLKITAIVNNVSSVGQNDGSISLDLESGNPDTRFYWSNGARTKDVKGLSPGLYKVKIISGRNCSLEKQFTVKEPMKINFTVKDVFCNGGSDGAVKARVSGGLPPYEFFWSNKKKGNYINKLSAGKYYVKVIDQWGGGIY